MTIINSVNAISATAMTPKNMQIIVITSYSIHYTKLYDVPMSMQENVAQCKFHRHGVLEILMPAGRTVGLGISYNFV